MGQKVYKCFDQNINLEGYGFDCLCGSSHLFYTEKPNVNGAKWTFVNNDFDNPTFSPSMHASCREAGYVCHFVITSGKIHFLNDCTHKFSGQTIEMEDIESTN